MKRARRKAAGRRSDLFADKEKRLIVLLSISALLLLLLNLFLPRNVSRPPSRRDRQKISAVVGRVLQQHGLEKQTAGGDSVIVIMRRSDSFPDIYAALQRALAPEGAEIVDCRKLGSSYLLTCGKGGAAAKHYFFRPASEEQQRGSLTLIIDDFGYSFNRTVRDFISLDAPLTVSVLPGLDYSLRVAQAAAKEGKEVIVHLPMEPVDEPFKDDGYIILTRHDADVISNRVRKAFAAVPTAAGLNNHQGSKATADRRTMSAVMETLKSMDKFFVDSRTSTRSVALQAAKEAGIRCARNEFFLDAEDDEAFIRRRLKAAASAAAEGHRVVVIGHVREKTLAVLQEMLPTIRAQGVVLLPASQAVN